MEEMIFYLIILALMAYWCHSIASKKGRSKGLAIFMGLLFGIFAVIGYYIIPPIKEKQIENAKKILEREQPKVDNVK